jgi:outer membrane protein OmpA-like peptidoglycan-associated protein
MKKALSLLLLILALAPACGKKKKNVETRKNGSMNIPLANGDRRSFFDDEVGAFVLEDDAMAQGESQQTSWVAQADTKQFKAVYFDFDKYAIRNDQEQQIEADVQAARKLASSEQKEIVIEGHACHSAGSKAYNLILSEHRAQTVAKRLEEEGVPADSMKVVGRGTEMPVVLGGSREEQWPNRRVEVFPLS